MANRGKDEDRRAGDPHAGLAVTSPLRAAMGNPSVARTTAAGQDEPPVARGGLSDLTRNRLAAQLRAMYDAVAQQPVPDRFAELIAKLDDRDRENV